jgi:hypothetical protein
VKTVGTNSDPERFERTSEPNLSEKAAKLGLSSRSNRKSDLLVSFRSTKNGILEASALLEI